MAKKKRAKAGQPPKPPGEKRTVKKEVAFSPKEWETIERLRGDEKAPTFIQRRALRSKENRD